MEKFLGSQEGEIVFASSESKKSQAIRRAVLAQRLRKLAPKIYTTNCQDSPERIIKRNQYLILGRLFSGAILSHRTALEGGPTKDGLIILTYKYTKKILLPGLTIRLLEGASPQEGDMPFMGNLFIASRERALLENLQSARGQFPKTLSLAEIEIFLDKICKIQGETVLNAIRDKARELAPKLKLEKEFKQLDQLIGAILNTRTDYLLQSMPAKARAQGKPYDVSRIELLAILTSKLMHAVLSSIPDKNVTEEAAENAAFFEAYFSNYIEGTEFEVEEAADIVFHHKLMPNRPEDAHDIVGTYKIVSNKQDMKTTPHSPEQFIALLKKRHQFLMSVRHDKNPGEFKKIANRAGDTVFVQPELVMGTLEKSFELYETLPSGLKRAIFTMFCVSEIHPFDDGNGRIARIMMNAELAAVNQCRIIVPTVYRDDYLLALRRLSRAHDPDAYIKMLTRAQAFTASIDFSDYEYALRSLRAAHAFQSPFEGKLVF